MVLLAKNYNGKKNNPQVLSIKAISQKEGVPFDFLEKIIERMEKANLVKGKKGVSGGYILSRPPNKISAKDIVFALEDNKKAVDCSFCNRSRQCCTKSVWAKIDKSFNKTLKSITLKDLIK